MRFLNQAFPFINSSALTSLKKIKLFIICLPFFLVYGCQNNRTENKELTDSAPSQSSTIAKDSTENTRPNIKKTIAIDSVTGRAVVEQTIAYSDLPIMLEESFTKDYQRLKIKITDVVPSTLKAVISTKVNRYNVRINQIKLPDGSFDGPFSRYLSHKIKSNGEVWLMIGKDNMASGTDNGEFELQISASTK